jgi:hypothetical protein
MQMMSVMLRCGVLRGGSLVCLALCSTGIKLGYG